MPTRISLPDHLLPVQALFNAAWEEAFIDLIDSLSRGIGYVINDCGCEFPSGLEPGEEPFEGVRFWLFDEEVTLTEREFHEILKQVCETQKKRIPEQAARIDAIVAKLPRRARVDVMSTQAMLPWFFRLHFPWALNRLFVTLVLVGCQLIVFLHFSLRWHSSLDFYSAAAWYESLVVVLVSSALLSIVGAFWPARPWLIAWALGFVGVVSTGAAAAPPEGYTLFHWKHAPLLGGMSMSPGPYKGNWANLLLDGGGLFVALLLATVSGLLLTLHRALEHRRGANAADFLLLGSAGCTLILMLLSEQEPLLVLKMRTWGEEPETRVALSATDLGESLWTIVGAIAAVLFVAAVLSFAVRWWWLWRVARGRIAGFALEEREEAADCGVFFDVPRVPLGLVLVRRDGEASVPIGRVVSIFSVSRS